MTTQSVNAMPTQAKFNNNTRRTANISISLACISMALCWPASVHAPADKAVNYWQWKTKHIVGDLWKDIACKGGSGKDEEKNTQIELAWLHLIRSREHEKRQETFSNNLICSLLANSTFCSPPEPRIPKKHDAKLKGARVNKSQWLFWLKTAQLKRCALWWQRGYQLLVLETTESSINICFFVQPRYAQAISMAVAMPRNPPCHKRHSSLGSTSAFRGWVEGQGNPLFLKRPLTDPRLIADWSQVAPINVKRRPRINTHTHTYITSDYLWLPRVRAPKLPSKFQWINQNVKQHGKSVMLKMQTTNGYAWMSIDMQNENPYPNHGHGWKHMGIHGYPWRFIDIRTYTDGRGSQEGGPRNRGRSHKIGHQKARPLTWKYKNLKFLLCVRSAVHYAWLLKFEWGYMEHFEELWIMQLLEFINGRVLDSSLPIRQIFKRIPGTCNRNGIDV